MKVLVCILNWRTAQLTLRSIAAVVPQVRRHPGSRVCVVDNDSQDGSLAAISAEVEARGWRDVVDVVASGQNGGYGFGNNVALRRGLRASPAPDYFYLLNSDAFVEENALDALSELLEAQRDVGMAGSLLCGPDGALHDSCFRFPSAWSELERTARLGMLSTLLRRHIVHVSPPEKTTADIDWVSGASLMIRREVLEQVGLFDETYFLYYEETDLCLRAHRAGWRIAFVRESKVVHIAGASTGVTSHRVVPTPMPKYIFESRRHYFMKNHGRMTLLAANAAHLVGGASFRIRRRLQGKADPERPREWIDGVRFNLRHP